MRTVSRFVFSVFSMGMVGALAAMAVPVSASEPRVPLSTNRTPLSEAVTFTGAAGQVSRGDATAATSFGVRTVHDHRNKVDIVISTFYFESSASACDDQGCTFDTTVVYGPDIDKLVTGRVTVSADLRRATLAPTRLPVLRSHTRYDINGVAHRHDTTTTEVVSATSGGAGTLVRERLIETWPGSGVLIMRGPRRPSTTKVTLDGHGWHSAVGTSTISSKTARLWSDIIKDAARPASARPAARHSGT